MPGEFAILATAMNHTGESLSRIVSVAARTAEEVSSSAHDLASVSEQISLSASQMASAMTEVSQGAEVQVQQLRTVDDTLQAIREAADGVKQRSSEVTDLAHSIEGAAQEKRVEIDRANRGVRILRAQDARVQHAGQGQVAREARLARHLGARVDPRDGLSDDLEVAVRRQRRRLVDGHATFDGSELVRPDAERKSRGAELALFRHDSPFPASPIASMASMTWG